MVRRSDQMFLFKCTVILAILCGVNSYHCVRDCDENGLIPTGTKPTPFDDYTYESLLTGCVDDTHCSGCTPGTGHKLYDNITELVPLERCYSICFSNVSDQRASLCRDLSVSLSASVGDAFSGKW